MMSPETLISRAESSGFVRGVDRTPTGHFRIETVLDYPDGSSIEVFVPQPGRLVDHHLTDFGQTMAVLHQMDAMPSSSPRRRRLFAQILRKFGVVQDGGALECPYANERDLPRAIVSLAKCCFRVSDLLFTIRASAVSTFNEQMGETLSALHVPFEANAPIALPNDNVVYVDFLVRKRTGDAAILTLSTANEQHARTKAYELFAKWHDLRRMHRPEARITIFDDRFDVYRGADLERLSIVSTLVPASDRSAIARLVAA